MAAFTRWERDQSSDPAASSFGTPTREEGTEMLTPRELRSRMSAYVDAVNGRDPEIIAGLFSEDAVQADPVSNPPNVGRTAITAFFENGIAASDSWTFTAQAVHTCAAHMAIDFRISVETGGTTMTIDGIEVFTIDADGLFTAVHAYWDDADLTLG
jgi:steroid delta-isomerase